MKKLLFVLLVPAYFLMASPQGVPGEFTATCGTSVTQFIPQNNSRAYLIFQNQGTDAAGHCHVKAGSAIVSGEGLWIDQKQNFETVEAFTKQPWWCKCDSDGQTIEVMYTNY